MMLSDALDCSSGTPVFVAANLRLPSAGDVPFADLGVLTVVLDTAAVFAVEFSPGSLICLICCSMIFIN